MPTAPWVTVSWIRSAARATPKSITRGPSRATSTLDGFRSRCTRPALWIDSSASAQPAASHRTAGTSSGPQARTSRLQRRGGHVGRGQPGHVSIGIGGDHGGGEDPADPPRRGHFMRETGPETGFLSEFNLDCLDRHQPAGGGLTQVHLAHGTGARGARARRMARSVPDPIGAAAPARAAALSSPPHGPLRLGLYDAEFSRDLCPASGGCDRIGSCRWPGQVRPRCVRRGGAICRCRGISSRVWGTGGGPGRTP